MSPPRLVLLRGGGPSVLVCGHCGRHEEHAIPAGTLPASRVCGACGLGLLLAPDPALVPAPGDAFLLVDRGLAVAAVSGRAEVLLGADEAELAGHRLAEVLAPARAVVTPRDLAALVAVAARGTSGVRTLSVRPPGAPGPVWPARIGPCRAPAVALVLLG